MRDAFGGVFMMRLMLVFIVIYVAFTAISFKYAKSFKIKNKVIDFVEQNQITDIETFFDEATGKNLSKIDDVLAAANYDISCTELGQADGNGYIYEADTNRIKGYCYNGVKIVKNAKKSTKDTIYYDIYTYVDWNLGTLNSLLVLGGKKYDSEESIIGKWTISGEAVVAKK